MKILAVTQARYGSSRMPGKVLMDVNGQALLSLHLQRALQSSLIQRLIVATTEEPEADRITKLARAAGCLVYQGALTDVLDRFYQAVVPYDPDYVVRITSDCPLIDAAIIDTVIKTCIDGDYDYCSNTLNPTFPDGMDVEVFRFAALEAAWNEASLQSDREHVTSFIWRNSTFNGGNRFRSFNYENASRAFAGLRLTVDEPADLELIRKVVSNLGADRSWKDYATFVQNNHAVSNLNAHLQRNEGFMKSLVQDKIVLRDITNFRNSDVYRAQIHDLIPGGAHTYSKGDDQFPRLAPAAITHGSGAYVWDVDGNKFLDCSMGLTSVGLGHAYKSVNDRVKAELDKGVNFQRPAAIERDIAETFLSLVPTHDMIKFGKNGSLVITAAIKLARAFNGRKLVAFPVDHPFYSYDDWFIGKTPAAAGIPEENVRLSVTYNSSDLASLEALFIQYPGQISCVVSEPEKNWGIPEGYLDQLIEITHRHGALYIQDEMITGFKTDFPGSIRKYDSRPDMATWGKGIANGYSFCALTGTKEVMELGGIRNTGAEKVFLISTTHGGETGPIAACLATIEEYRTKNVIAHNHAIGDSLVSNCAAAVTAAGLDTYVDVVPCNWMPLFVFNDKEGAPSSGLRTLAMQEMIRSGVLFQGAFVPCFSHSMDDVAYFTEAFSRMLGIYANALDSGYEHFLVGEPVKPVFRKYL